MDVQSHMLDDEAMLHFLIRGFVVVKTGVDPEVHTQILEDAKQAVAEGNPGNDILHKAPGLHEIYKDPALVGTLKSILGDSYVMHCHRHCHLNPAGREGKPFFHQDGSTRRFAGWSRPWRRHHRPRTLMAISYPHRTPVEMGPTGVVPGTPYYHSRLENSVEYEFPFAVVDPGDVLLVHFDLWHRVSTNSSDRDRYMMKFLFKRTEEPVAPNWQTDPDFDPGFDTLVDRLDFGHPSDVLLKHPLPWEFMWQWSRGEALPEWGDEAPVSVEDMIGDLASEDPGLVLDATYALGRLGKRAVPTLMDILLGDDEVQRNLVSAALSATGGAAVDALVDTLTHSDDWVRATAADTLGDIGLPAIDALPAIRKALSDDYEWVRHNATRALTIWSKAADISSDELIDVLEDQEPFVSFNVVTAMEHMGYIDEQMVSVLKGLQDHEHGRLRYLVNDVLRRVA